MISQTTITWIIVASIFFVMSIAVIVKLYIYHQQIDDDSDHKNKINYLKKTQ
jgi:hypothetical protein